MGLEAVLATWTLGLVSGMRHAFEADHVAAVSTLVAEGHGSRRAAWLGAWWGLGHTAALLGVGLALGLVRAELSPGFEQWLEFLVGLMLLGLGVRAVARGLAEMRRGADAWHVHRGHTHHHPATGRHVHVGTWALSPRSFVVGIVHGLAGSGALVAVAMAQLTTTPARLLYVALFGLGSVAAMAAVSGLAGWQLAQWSARPGLHGRFQIAAGVLSLIVGVVWASPLLQAF
jgi:sulfite exporter TauE/SafE